MTRRQIRSANRVFEVLEHFGSVRRPQALRDVVSAGWTRAVAIFDDALLPARA